jgi:hypothetical protein
LNTNAKAKRFTHAARRIFERRAISPPSATPTPPPARCWPCGLTALAALQEANIPFFIAHAPGAMLATDLKEGEPA